MSSHAISWLIIYRYGHALVQFDPKAEARLRWKIDLYIIPTVALLYLFCFIDRANIGNARLAGLEKELKLTGYDYNSVLSVFYISYIIFEVCQEPVLSPLSRCWIEKNWSAILLTGTDMFDRSRQISAANGSALAGSSLSYRCASELPRSGLRLFTVSIPYRPYASSWEYLKLVCCKCIHPEAYQQH